VSLATLESIRDRILTVVESITPTSLSDVKFRRHRAERDGNLTDWAEKNPAASFRRFSASEVSDDELPDVSSQTEEWVLSTIEVRIAYPQTHRYGPDNERDRKDVMNRDWKAINQLVGIYGRGSFSGTNDCTPMGAIKSFDSGAGGIDFLVVRVQVRYCRLIA
jgi:hypothetical protein